MLETNNFIKASPGNRFLAYLSDGLITSVCAIPGALIGFSYEFINYSKEFKDTIGITGGVIALLSIIGYLLFRDGLSGGRSIGKKWLGIRVVRLDNGEECSFGKSAFRNFIWLIVAIPYLGWLLFAAEAILTLANPQGKRIGDMLADTMVIEDKK